MQLNLEKDCWY